MDKQPTLLSSEGDAELKRLYADLAHSSRGATAFLRTSGMTSVAFLRADRELTRIVKRIKEIRRPYWQALDGALITGCVAPAIILAASRYSPQSAATVMIAAVPPLLYVDTVPQ